MKDRVFLDTNVLVYAKLETEDDREKRDTAIALIQQLKDRPVVSIQVLNEFSSVLIRHNISNHIIREAIQAIIEDSIVIPLDIALVWQTWMIKDKYIFSYWDSMITAAALKSGCNILYSEDLQHEQLMEDQLKIINPFHVPHP